MSEWIAISRTQHAGMQWRPRHGYRFTAEQPVTLVMVAELVKLLPHYVLGFIPQNDGYQLVVLTGLEAGQNLYLAQDGRWLAGYVPAALRGYPFTLAGAKDNQQVLCIEQKSLIDKSAADERLVNENQAEPLFDDDGELAQRVKQTLDFLGQCERNRATTQAACQALGEAGVIEPWPLKVDHGEDKPPLEVKGLYRINEHVLNELDAQAFTRLRGHGALALAYAQVFSMGQLAQLGERARLQENQQAQHSATGSSTLSLDAFFDEDDDDLSFDFDR